MPYIIEGLDPRPFAPLFALDTAGLHTRGIHIVTAEDDCYPCRVSLDEAAIGDRLLLLNHQHQPADGPYRSAHAIYVAEGSNTPGRFVDDIPPIMRPRILSIRAFDADHMIVDADVTDGNAAEALIRRLLDRADTSYLHVHFAKRGCFAATVRRG